MDHLPIKAEIYLQRASHTEPRTLIVGLLHGVELLRGPKDCQLILGSLIVIPQRRFDMTKECYGWRIEDILREKWDTSKLKELPL